MVEAKLQARLIGEWSGGERRRARRSVCDGDGVADAQRLRCGEGESQKSEMGSEGSAASAGLDVVRFGLALPRWEGRW